MDITNIHLKSKHKVRYITYAPGTPWYYLSKQTRDEATLFTIYDSHPGPEGVQSVIHTSFTQSRAPKDAPARESFEVRAFVFSGVPNGKDDGSTDKSLGGVEICK